MRVNLVHRGFMEVKGYDDVVYGMLRIVHSSNIREIMGAHAYKSCKKYK